MFFPFFLACFSVLLIVLGVGIIIVSYLNKGRVSENAGWAVFWCFLIGIWTAANVEFPKNETKVSCPQCGYVSK